MIVDDADIDVQALMRDIEDEVSSFELTSDSEDLAD